MTVKTQQPLPEITDLWSLVAVHDICLSEMGCVFPGHPWFYAFEVCVAELEAMVTSYLSTHYRPCEYCGASSQTWSYRRVSLPEEYDIGVEPILLCEECAFVKSKYDELSYEIGDIPPGIG